MRVAACRFDCPDVRCGAQLRWLVTMLMNGASTSTDVPDRSGSRQRVVVRVLLSEPHPACCEETSDLVIIAERCYKAYIPQQQPERYVSDYLRSRKCPTPPLRRGQPLKHVGSCGLDGDTFLRIHGLALHQARWATATAGASARFQAVPSIAGARSAWEAKDVLLSAG